MSKPLSENVAGTPEENEPAPTLLRQGNREAFDRLYVRYAPRVLGLLLRLTQGNRSEAEDLTQDTFVASYTACGTYAERGRPLAWLCGIAFRRWRDRQRSATPPTLPLSESLAHRDDVERGVLDRTTLDRALAQLEPAYREVLLLIAGQQLTYRETAAITGEPVGTVKWRFHEATRRMRLLLQNDELASLAPGANVTPKPRHFADSHEERSNADESGSGASQIARSGGR
ncbi:MAG: RNA polymerase sigma factor [Capsulimonadales bacterium]|nr:RNA polymerase sigma factor [Capsulimonadales bacterium]